MIPSEYSTFSCKIIKMTSNQTCSVESCRRLCTLNYCENLSRLLNRDQRTVITRMKSVVEIPTPRKADASVTADSLPFSFSSPSGPRYSDKCSRSHYVDSGNKTYCERSCSVYNLRNSPTIPEPETNAHFPGILSNRKFRRSVSGKDSSQRHLHIGLTSASVLKFYKLVCLAVVLSTFTGGVQSAALGRGRKNSIMNFNPIIFSAQSAKLQADDFKDEYVIRTFGTNFSDTHSSYKDAEMDELPNKFSNIAKEFGVQINEDQLSHLKKDVPKTLEEIYIYLMKFKSALNRVASEEQSFKGDFYKAANLLGIVLEEISTFLKKFGIKYTQNDDTSALPGYDNDAYHRLRDWIVLRDYLNALDYVIDIFSYLNQECHL